MRFRDLRKPDLERLAEKLGTSYGYLKHIKSFRRRPSVDLAKRIVDVTNGLITLDDLLFSPEYEKRRKANSS